ncbi:TonB family protein [Psychrobacter sp. 16-MNA-CIBAN-0192]|uniref:energy transducer TonB n=1 Tax=Psychrobacter sp. 16-MNA-CIBAN-0192 TaxID=3140448 RepID=UPI0033198450
MMTTTVRTRAYGSLRAWVTLLVIVWHSLMGWALITMDSSEQLTRPKTPKKAPNIIQLELITLTALPTKALPKKIPSSSQMPPITSVDTAKPVAIASNSLATLPISTKASNLSSPNQAPQVKESSLNQPAITSTEQEKPATASNKTETPTERPISTTSTSTTPSINQPIVNQPVYQYSTFEQPSINQPSDEQFTVESAALAEQQLVINELRKIAKQTTAEETDLTALIQAVTKQFNRDQAQQQQAALQQTNKRRIEQEQLLTGANILDEAKFFDKNEQTAPPRDEAVSFLEQQLTWLEDKAPLISVPSQVWQNIEARSGDIFTVMVTLYVDKDGHITQVHLLESSGNQIIDAIAMVQVRAGQLVPFRHNGRTVDGMVPMTLRYEMP